MLVIEGSISMKIGKCFNNSFSFCLLGTSLAIVGSSSEVGVEPPKISIGSSWNGMEWDKVGIKLLDG